MRKIDVINEVSEKTGIEKPKVEATVEAFMATVKEHIINKDHVSLRGFGNFILKKRAAKIARNISKNTPINLPAHYIPAFRPSKQFSVKVKRNVKLEVK
jgi:DNA-binding protein HU-beta